MKWYNNTFINKQIHDTEDIFSGKSWYEGRCYETDFVNTIIWTNSQQCVNLFVLHGAQSYEFDICYFLQLFESSGAEITPVHNYNAHSHPASLQPSENTADPLMILYRSIWFHIHFMS